MSTLDPLEKSLDLALDKKSAGAVADGQLPDGFLVAQELDHRGLRLSLPH